jgi:gliding motility-associated-like protein
MMNLKSDKQSRIYLFDMKKILFLFLLSGITAFSQTFTPCFKILDAPAPGGNVITRACIGQKIFINNCSNKGNNVYRFQTGGAFQQDSSFTYSSPGKFTITQSGSQGGTGNEISQDITILPKPSPQFTVSYCTGLQVKVTITDVNYDQFVVDFGDNIKQTVSRGGSASRNFPAATQRFVQVSGIYNGTNCLKDTVFSVNPVPTVQAPVWKDLSSPSSTSAFIRFETQPQFSYTLLRQPASGGAEQTVAAFNPPASNPAGFTDPDLAAGAVYRYRIRAADGCGNQAFSPVLQTVNLTAVAVPNQINLSWQLYTLPGFVKFQLFRNGQFFNEFPNGGIINFADTQIECFKTYTYQLLAIANGVGISSQNVSATAIINRQPAWMGNATANVVNGKTELNWEAPPKDIVVKNYKISRSVEGADFQLVQTLTALKFSDKEPKSRTCYRLTYEDSCGNISAERLVCPVFLSEDNKLLIWSPYSGWQNNNVSYTLEKLDEAGKVVTQTATGTDLSLLLPELDTSAQVLRYRIRTTNGTLTAYSNTLTVEQPARLSVPNAFSPDGRGPEENEIFRAEGFFIQNFKMVIYNRWGQAVFATDNLQTGWDGTIKSEQAPPENYVYVAEGQDFTGKKFTRKGTLTLIR